VKLTIVSNIVDYSAKKNLVGFYVDENYYTAILLNLSNIQRIEPGKHLLLWIHEDRVYSVDRNPENLTDPPFQSLAIPFLRRNEFGSIPNKVLESKTSGASSIVGIHDIDGIIRENGNGIMMDDNGLYLVFGKSKIVLGANGINVEAPSFSVPHNSDREHILSENDLTMLPSFALLPIPKDVINLDLISSLFGI